MSLERLKIRAEMLEKARAFFKERKVLEVDVNALIPRAPIDANIDVISVPLSLTQTGYLHTSPEYAMKKLLAKGSGDIYYLGHVFRKGELGRLHNPEFTMAEWYRTKLSFPEMIEETAAFLFLFFGKLPIRYLSYQEAFITYTDLDPFTASLETLRKKAEGAPSWDRQDFLDYLLTQKIEPKLGDENLTVLLDYPPNQAALAKTTLNNGLEVAERFEIYYKGVELTNGYHELANGSILRERFTLENEKRVKEKKETYLLDEEFLSVMNSSFPECSGVSVGFDRALMLMTKETAIQNVM